MNSIYLLLTILSVLAVWSLLTALIVGLLYVFKALESIRDVLHRIAMGVRAIEQETAPLENLASQLPSAANTLLDALAPIARRARG